MPKPFLYLIAFCLMAGPAWAEDLTYCQEGLDAEDPQTKIDLYTKCINTGDLSSENLAVTYRNRGFHYESVKQYDRAILDFDQTIRLDPNDPYSYGGLGYAYGGSGLYTLAIESFTEAIRLQSDYADAYNGRCWVNAIHLSQYGQALPDCQRATQLTPDVAYMHNDLAKVYEGLSDNENAIKEYRRMLELDPNAQSAIDALKQLGAM